MDKYKNSAFTAEERADDLLSKMTLCEKISQMVVCGTDSIDEYYADIERGGKPDFFGTFVLRDFDPVRFNRIQRYFTEETRLGIPCILAAENTHGICNPYTAVFPTTGCLAATFDERLAERMAELSGLEARALGIRQVYAPNVDIARDPRWGRFEENYGEDPVLSGKMGAAYVRGIQSAGVAATAKHYLCYGVPEGGLNLAPAHMGEREIRNDFLGPFRDCIEAGVMAIMPAYNEIDGIPVHASHHWMVDVLRKELGFEGVVVSDYDAIKMLGFFHRVAETELEAGKIALENAVDVEACGCYGYGDDFLRAAEESEIDIRKIDECVRRILIMKFRLGLFEQPYAEEDFRIRLNTDKEKQLALEIAEQGIVLLKNDGVLPLSGNGKRIALIGPNADINELGNYIYYDIGELAGKPPCVTSATETLRFALSRRAGRENVLYARGCSTVYRSDTLLEEALKIANSADVVVLAMGSNSRQIGGGTPENVVAAVKKCETTSGEGYDMPYVELPACQRELIEKIAETGKPIVLLLYGGRAHAIAEETEKVQAILQVFGPGEMGGKAIAELLFGDKSPSGKLPFSMPRSTGHIPCFYNHKPSARGSLYRHPGNKFCMGMDYVTDTPQALFPFGYGISYTHFSYSALTAKRETKGIRVFVRIKNDGEYDAYESVLLFVRCHYRKVTPPVKELKAFRKIFLKKGEEQEVIFSLSVRDFEYYDENMKAISGKGRYTVFISELSMEVEIK